MTPGKSRCPDTNREVTMTPTTKDMVMGAMVTPITKMTNTMMAMMPMAHRALTADSTIRAERVIMMNRKLTASWKPHNKFELT